MLVLKGSCSESPLDWLFYIEKDEEKSIFYEGYKNSKMILKNGSWHIVDNSTKRSDLIVEMGAGQDGSKIPLGRHDWKILDTACKQDKLDWSSLTISVCVLDQHFSCDSGECVSIFQRCDHNEDCDDGSDEKDCNVLRMLPSYEKSAPPELKRELIKSNPIFTQINILNVDFVDTISMSVGLTIEIHFMWRDHRIVFENILDGQEKFDMPKVVAKRGEEMIWLPMQEIIHDNVVIGKVIEDKVFYVKVVGRSTPYKMALEESVEALLYDGSQNDLTMTQRFKLEYRCDFFLKNYPFDEQMCKFVLLMNLKGNNSIKFMENNPPVIYNGPNILTEFEMKDFFVNTTLTEFRTTFIYNMRLERLYMQAVSTTFFQSFLLWFIAYFTLFINITDFGNRFMGALTSLLVLAALLSSINASLPQTAYFKHIDIWFFFFVINIALIVFLHITIDIFLTRESGVYGPNVILSMKENSSGKHMRINASSIVNTAAKIIIPVILFCFMVAYFCITVSE